MKTEDIKKMAQAFQQVQEASKKKMDPVDKGELKGTHADRKDKDIDNDGDVDSSDEYLHNRRKTVNKAIKSKGKEEVETQTEGKKPGLWDRIRSKRARGEKPAKPGDEDYPDKKQWDKLTKEETVYERILEARKQPNATGGKPDGLKDDDTLPGKGAKEMDKDLAVTTDKHSDYDEKGHDDVAKAGRAGPTAKKRPADQATGDKSVVNPVKGK